MRHFLFLQGPHGPFFSHLGRVMAEGDFRVSRIAFNAADEYFWPDKTSRVAFTDVIDQWPPFLANYIESEAVTDIVLYGDARPNHVAAIEIAKERDITLHFFEEGYLRPYWVNYERGGVNGDSALIDMDMQTIRGKRQKRQVDLRDAPAHWGQAFQHNWYGFFYHFRLWLGRSRFPNYRPHRGVSIMRELRLNAMRLLGQPWRVVKRDVATKRFLREGYPYFIVPLQLEHDASLQKHSDYRSQRDFIDEVISAFAKGTDAPTRLVFKLHPFDDGRVPIKDWVADAAQRQDVRNRVVVVSGGALSRIIAHARGGVAVNSTSVQQLLWRGIPIRLMGRSIFGKDEFASSQPLEAFFRDPDQPNREAFLEFRSYLLETSQIVGGFYTAEGRAEVVRSAVELLRKEQHSYDL